MSAVWQVRSWPPQQLNDAVRRTQQNCLEPVLPTLKRCPRKSAGASLFPPRRAVPPVVRTGTRSCSRRGWPGCSTSSRQPETQSPANRSRMGAKKPAADEPLHTLPLHAFLLAPSFKCMVVRSVSWSSKWVGTCPQRTRCLRTGCTLRHVTPCRLLRGNLRLPGGNLLKAGGLRKNRQVGLLW